MVTLRYFALTLFVFLALGCTGAAVGAWATGNDLWWLFALGAVLFGCGAAEQEEHLPRTSFVAGDL